MGYRLAWCCFYENTRAVGEAVGGALRFLWKSMTGEYGFCPGDEGNRRRQKPSGAWKNFSEREGRMRYFFFGWISRCVEK